MPLRQAITPSESRPYRLHGDEARAVKAIRRHAILNRNQSTRIAQSHSVSTNWATDMTRIAAARRKFEPAALPPVSASWRVPPGKRVRKAAPAAGAPAAFLGPSWIMADRLERERLATDSALGGYGSAADR
jgi:hypothetical protein